jgi:hypothetical protein
MCAGITAGIMPASLTIRQPKTILVLPLPLEVAANAGALSAERPALDQSHLQKSFFPALAPYR